MDNSETKCGGGGWAGGGTGGGAYYISTIQFTLTSKQCEEKGWILHEGNLADNEKEAALDWAVHKLKYAKRQIREQESREKEAGYERPLQIRYYGDSKKEAMAKYRKGSSKSTSSAKSLTKLPTIPSLEWNDRQSLFMTCLPDGSMTLYYPNGQTAIITSKAGPGKPGFYTLVYSNMPEGAMLASFTPWGGASVNHSNGLVKFLTNNNGGRMADEYGALIKTFDWPENNAKLTIPITLQLNNFITFRCVSLSQMHLLFNCQNEQIKVHVGLVPGAEQPKAEDLGILTSGLEMRSQTAQEQMKRRPQQQKQKSKTKKEKGKAAEITELKKASAKLDGKYDNETDRERCRFETKAKNTCDEWLEHYRVHVGITSPGFKNLSDSSHFSRRRNVQSAKESPTKALTSVKHRAPSAPAGPPRDRPDSSRIETTENPPSDTEQRPTTAVKFQDVSSLMGDLDGAGDQELMTVSTTVASRKGSSLRPTSNRQKISVRRLRTSFCFPDQTNLAPPVGVCTLSLRKQMLGGEAQPCRCSRHHIPYITDIEYDEFITNHVPLTQLIIVSVMSSLFPQSGGCSHMVETLYQERNKNRTRPCLQVRSDPIRLVRYDMATAAFNSDHTQPLLLTRHNVVPGMFLMYQNKKLLFCDHIFNGYGNARKDFQKQVTKTRRDAHMGFSMPCDFKFSPQKGRQGPRAAWGGEIGGAGTDRRGNSGTAMPPLSRTSSDSSIQENKIPILRPQTVHYQISELILPTASDKSINLVSQSADIIIKEEGPSRATSAVYQTPPSYQHLVPPLPHWRARLAEVNT